MIQKKGGLKMKQSQIAIIIGAVIIVVGGYLLMQTSSNSSQPSPTQPEGTSPAPTLNKNERENDTTKVDNGSLEQVQEQGEAPLPQAPKGEVMTEEGSSLVTYTTASGYTPAILKVKKGSTVVFKNESDKDMWTASALHPTHTVYPDSDIKKCGTDDSIKIFDMCQGLAKDQQWSFTFNEVGTWKYHNHLRVSDTGSIVVE